jgi:hypothetical protein
VEKHRRKKEKPMNLHRLSCTAVLSLVLGLTAAWAVVSPYPSAAIRKNPSAGTRHRREVNASRNAGFVPALSDLALIIWAEMDASFAIRI